MRCVNRYERMELRPFCIIIVSISLLKKITNFNTSLPTNMLVIHNELLEFKKCLSRFFFNLFTKLNYFFICFRRELPVQKWFKYYCNVRLHRKKYSNEQKILHLVNFLAMKIDLINLKEYLKISKNR